MSGEKVGRKSLQAKDKFESCSFYRAFPQRAKFFQCAIYIKRQVQEKSLIMVYIHYFFSPLLAATRRHPPQSNIKENSSSGVNSCEKLFVNRTRPFLIRFLAFPRFFFFLLRLSHSSQVVLEKLYTFHLFSFSRRLKIFTSDKMACRDELEQIYLHLVENEYQEISMG